MVKALLFFLGLLALLALAWMALLPLVVEHQLRAVTGFDVRLTSLAANPFTGTVDAEGILVHNPAPFPVPDFVDARAVRADVNEFSWFAGDRFEVNSLDLDVSRVELVLRQGGGSNAAAFASGLSQASPGGAPAEHPAAPASPAGKGRPYIIRRLHVRFDQLVIADYSHGQPELKTYDLHLDHTFSNVTSPSQLLVPDVVRSLYSFGIGRDVARLVPGDFGRALGDAVGAVSQVLPKIKDAEKKAKDYLKGILDKLEH